MLNGEREIIMTIEKIFNWQPPSEYARFQLAFYSLKTSALILDRTVSASPLKGEMVFNYSLRITYLPEENQVVLRICHIAGRKGAVLLGEFMLNLDALRSRKVQFFPFGSNDRVLKIIVGDSQQSERCPLHGALKNSTSDSQTFFKEKHQFLQRVINNASTSSIKHDSSRSKKSFSQRARELLGQVQGMRGKKREEQGRSIEQEFNDYYNDPIGAYYTQQDRMITSKHDPAPKIIKSQSEQRLHLQGRAKLATQRQSESQRRSNRSQKHKLQLNNLQMVAVQNEYYDEPLEQRKLKRRSDVYGQTHYYSRQKLQKSQFY